MGKYFVLKKLQNYDKFKSQKRLQALYSLVVILSANLSKRRIVNHSLNSKILVTFTKKCKEYPYADDWQILLEITPFL